MKYRLFGILLSVMLVSGCIAAAVSSLKAFADPGESAAETESMEETELELCTEIEIDHTVYTVSLSELSGELEGAYLADELCITDSESRDVLQDYYHIYDRADKDSLTVSLFVEDGFVTECVEDAGREFITLYRIGGPEEEYRVLETESVSFENAERILKIRALQELVAVKKNVMDQGEIVSEADSEEDALSSPEETSASEVPEDTDSEDTENTDASSDTEAAFFEETESDESGSDVSEEDTASDLETEASDETETISSMDVSEEESVSEEPVSAPAEETAENTSEDTGAGTEEVLTTEEILTEEELTEEPADMLSDSVSEE